MSTATEVAGTVGAAPADITRRPVLVMAVVLVATGWSGGAVRERALRR